LRIFVSIHCHNVPSTIRIKQKKSCSELGSLQGDIGIIIRRRRKVVSAWKMVLSREVFKTQNKRGNNERQ
jgi:hypothetical protein